MTPYELYQTYRSLSVPLTDGTTIFNLDIHEYRNHEMSGDFSTASGLKEYEKLKTAVEKNCKKLGTGKYQFNEAWKKTTGSWTTTVFKANVITIWPDLIRPFLGKGTPEDIRFVLRLAIHFELLKPIKSQMQRYCDENVGIDCSGFASAYYGGSWMGKDAKDYRDSATRVKKIADISPNDSIVFQNGKHIAVIDKITERDSTCVGCKVAESTSDQMELAGPSDGLNYTEYFLLFDGTKSSGEQKFKVLRSIVNSKGADDYYSPAVYVVRP